jgi:5-methylcytosine-specific restriction endonuclease McrA
VCSPTPSRARADMVPDKMASSRTSTPEWKRLRAEVLQRDPYCQVRWDERCTKVSNTVDHIIPTAAHILDNPDDPSNLRGSCRKCNQLKASAEGHYLSGHNVQCPWEREPLSDTTTDFLDRISQQAEQRRQDKAKTFVPRTIWIGQRPST